MDKWICTDPDTFQWQRHLGGRKYEMCDTQQVHENGEPLNARYAVHAVIDLNQYDDDYIDWLHKLYSLTERQHDNIIAEMAFETDEDSVDTVSGLLKGLGACSYITERYLIGE